MEHSVWNGYVVNGDIRELDAIVESTGFISLDKDDIISIFTESGENYVSIGIDKQIDKAFGKAIDCLPFSIERINNLLIDFRCGNIQPKMSELSKITSVISETSSDINIRWGISNDASLGDMFKVVLVASVNY